MASSVFIGFFPGVPWSTSGSTVTITGTVAATGFLAGDGTAAAPSYSFASDPTNGLYLADVDTVGIAAGGALRFYVDGSFTHVGALDIGFANDVNLSRGAANLLQLAQDDNLSLVRGFIQGFEQTAPSAPAANGYRIFAVDNGGKTELMVLFQSGAAIQLAIEV